jgi:hypothetical protein
MGIGNAAAAATTLVRVPVLDVADTLPIEGEGQPAPPSGTLRDPVFAERYGLAALLGEGGMGVVRLALDKRIGREVAMKTMRAAPGPAGELAVRFLREVCVQGQLEHPSVVPVYDLGRDPGGALFFTMKRVRGATFEEIIVRLRARDPEAEKQYTRRKLLTAFASVCQAVHFAHARGVVHRDLKPGNVMLGDFGEVYVLDWGVAKLVDTPEPHGAAAQPHVMPDHGGAAPTRLGVTLGTPGYMPPEQVRGHADVDARADVYALGAILFELLSLYPLHDGTTMEGKIISTLHGTADARVSVRAPHRDVAPELDGICVRATATAPADRFPSVGELLGALERYLDGDRDLERRRQLSRELAESARVAAEEALGDSADPTEARRRALRDLGHALALDPGNTEAVGTLVRLLTEPPRELPPDAVVALQASTRETQRATARGALLGYLAWFLLVPFGLWMGIGSVPAALLTSALWVAAAVSAYVALRRPDAAGSPAVVGLLATATAACATCAICGPYVLVPTLAVINVMLWLLVSDRSRRRLVIAVGCLTILAPAALEWAGVLSFYRFKDGKVIILQSMLDFPIVPTHAFLLAASLALVVITAVLITRFRDTLSQAERRLHLQAWQLRQLAPHGADAVTSGR